MVERAGAAPDPAAACPLTGPVRRPAPPAPAERLSAPARTGGGHSRVVAHRAHETTGVTPDVGGQHTARVGRRLRGAWTAAPRAQVALTPSPEYTPRASQTGLSPAPTAWPMNGRPGEAMPSVYCSRCGRPNRRRRPFLLVLRQPAAASRPAGERPGESTSTISLGGWETAGRHRGGGRAAADAAAVEALPPGTALLVVRRGPERRQPVPARRATSPRQAATRRATSSSTT